VKNKNDGAPNYVIFSILSHGSKNPQHPILKYPELLRYPCYLWRRCYI